MSTTAPIPAETVSSKTISLFPPPSSLSSPRVPRPLFGLSPGSLETLRQKLAENHDQYHIFFHDFQLHNHIAHHIIAIWSLGAQAPVITKAFTQDASIQRPITHGVTPDLEEITDSNFKDHLSNSRYYASYLKFFTSVVEEIGSVPAIEKYVFSNAYNVDSSKPAQNQPVMLQHYLAGFFHPMIHVGYGLEFGMPGMVIEGLAQAAVHRIMPNALIPNSWFTSGGKSNDAVSKVTTKLSSLFTGSGKSNKNTKPKAQHGTHAFNILAILESDPFYKLPNGPIVPPPPTLFGTYGEKLSELTDAWIGKDLNESVEDLAELLEEKMEELIWMACLMYGVGGWTADKEYSADFFSMHLVTASLFLPSNLATLSTRSSLLLLRSFFSWSLFLYVTRRNSNIDISGFYKATESTLSKTNPWFPILENAITHVDEHLPKLQRALAHYSSIYGSRKFIKEDGIKLMDAELLDGTLFVRIAQLTMEKLSKNLEAAGLTGSGQSQWDLPGLQPFPETIPQA